MSTAPAQVTDRPLDTAAAPAPQRHSALARSQVVARLLDDLIRVPGTSIGIGLDSLIGLIPGVGDGASTVLSTAILLEAVRCRVPLPVLARMGANLVFDAAIGVLPAVGDLADVAFQANKANVRLLRECLETGRTVDTSIPRYLLGAGAIVGATLAVLVIAMVVSLWLLWRLITGLG